MLSTLTRTTLIHAAGQCPYCHNYAWHSGQDPVRIVKDNSFHHPACPRLRPECKPGQDFGGGWVCNPHGLKVLV